MRRLAAPWLGLLAIQANQDIPSEPGYPGHPGSSGHPGPRQHFDWNNSLPEQGAGPPVPFARYPPGFESRSILLPRSFPLCFWKKKALRTACEGNCSCGSLFIRYNTAMAVTRRQKEILDFLESFVTRNGYSPSFEEIARGMGLKSLATVHKHITNLEKKGLLDRVHNRSRSIDVVPAGTRIRTSERLPLMGRIAAGLPVGT